MAPTGHIALSLDTLVFGERLQASVREMDAALRATSTVASVNYGVTGAALFDAQGRCLAMTVSDPLIFASVRIAPRALIDAFVFDLEDGDVLMANHPDYGGVAPTIVTIVAPVIVDAQYAGAAAVQYRLADLGGDLPGGWNMGATEWLAEGIALPPVKIVRAGRKAFDVWDMLQLNSREPADLAWNLDAALGACRIGAEQIKRLVQHWGSAGFERLSTDYLAYTGRLCRTLLGVVSSPATAEEEAVVVLPDGSLVR
ncbi:MAG: 5-oxoprolinase ATP-hydrolyzing, partial [Chloroflexi bacterium]|nr:5-oxoprolinase ATP-hydrolyzing [Chloroflexota bacterium]